MENANHYTFRFEAVKYSDTRSVISGKILNDPGQGFYAPRGRFTWDKGEEGEEFILCS